MAYLKKTHSQNKWKSFHGQDVPILFGDLIHVDSSTSRRFSWENYITLPKFNIAPENLPSQKERIVFQPSFFRGYVKLRECRWFHDESTRISTINGFHFKFWGWVSFQLN